MPFLTLPFLRSSTSILSMKRRWRNEGNGKACHLIPFPILWFLKLCLGEREGITLPNLPSMASLLPSYPSHPFTLLTTIGEREGYDVIASSLDSRFHELVKWVAVNEGKELTRTRYPFPAPGCRWPSFLYLFLFSRLYHYLPTIPPLLGINGR